MDRVPEYTSAELRDMGDAPSTSYREDWNETVDRIYHKQVTEVQIECLRYIDDFLSIDWFAKADEKYPNIEPEERYAGVEAMLDARIEMLRKDMKALIKNLDGLRIYRKASFDSERNECREPTP